MLSTYWAASTFASSSPYSTALRSAIGTKFWLYTYRPLAAIVFILISAVTPTATATAATMRTVAAILTDTGRLANQPGARPARAGEESVLTGFTPGEGVGGAGNGTTPMSVVIP